MKVVFLFLFLISGVCYAQIIPKEPVTGTKFFAGKPQHQPPDIINDYTEVSFYNICDNSFIVTNDSAFKIGDTVLLIQMKGALIDTSNTSNFGKILDYRNAGNYEFNYISQKAGNQLTFKNRLTKTYDIPDGVVQLVRIPYYKDGLFFNGLTCLPWDGSKGGVLALTVLHGIKTFGPIDVGGTGFKGGEGYNSTVNGLNCFSNNYNYPVSSQLSGFKGESIAQLSQNISKGKGSPAAGGGGGLSHNSGAGGGANAGSGGFGGYQSDTCGINLFNNGGLGGKSLLYSSAANKIFMGGGGGSGHADNTGLYPSTPSGGNGGGIIIIMADSLSLFGNTIFANGNTAQYCYSADCSDGRGGGGGGGTVLLKVNKIVDSLTVENQGGDGAFVTGTITAGRNAGPGGGGGGGAFFISKNTLPLNTAVINSGGISGFINTPGNNWGATAGAAGLNFFNLKLPFDTAFFIKNIDSVRIRDSIITCNKYNFSGNAFTNTFPIASWTWNFGDGTTGSGQNITHAYLSESTFPVSLFASDINGCRDSVTTIASPIVIPVNAGADTTVCSNSAITVTLNGTGTGSYAWSPATLLNDSTLINPLQRSIQQQFFIYLLPAIIAQYQIQ